MSFFYYDSLKKNLDCKKFIFLVFHRNEEMNKIFKLKNLYKAQLL